jgi:hypothetical protein
MAIISVRDRVNPWAIAQLKGLDQLKNPVTSWEIIPAAFWLVA